MILFASLHTEKLLLQFAIQIHYTYTHKRHYAFVHAMDWKTLEVGQIHPMNKNHIHEKYEQPRTDLYNPSGSLRACLIARLRNFIWSRFFSTDQRIRGVRYSGGQSAWLASMQPTVSFMGLMLFQRL